MLCSLRTILGIFPEYGYFPSIAHAILNALLNTFVLLSNYPSRCFVQTAICRHDAMTQFPGTVHRLRSNPDTHKHTQRKLISVRDTLCSLFTPWQSLFYFLFLHASLLSSRPHLQTCLGTGGGRGRWGRGRGRRRRRWTNSGCILEEFSFCCEEIEHLRFAGCKIVSELSPLNDFRWRFFVQKKHRTLHNRIQCSNIIFPQEAERRSTLFPSVR